MTRPSASRADTSGEEAVRLAERLARAGAAALGETVAGVILHGSLTLGDYVPGRSDIDLLAWLRAAPRPAGPGKRPATDSADEAGNRAE